MRNISRGMIAVIMVAALGIVTFATPANAGAELELRSVTKAPKDRVAGRDTCSFGTPIKSTGDAYGAACFAPSGDRLFVRDNAADGFRVGMQWRFANGARKGLCVHAKGNKVEPYPNGTGEDLLDAYSITVRWNCNHNFPEGARVEFRAGRCNASAKNCSKPRNWQNWGAWNRVRA